MFLNSYTTSSYKKRKLIDSFYQKIVNVSRKKFFYKNLCVPDTIDGRFDLLVFFSIIFTFFLSKCGSKGVELSQVLFDKLFLDLDLSLRELGAGDAGVHLKIKKLVNAYMARQKVYCHCLEINNFEMLKKHIIKNIYRNVDGFQDSPDHLLTYSKECVFLFNQKNDDYFLLNKFNFPKIRENII